MKEEPLINTYSVMFMGLLVGEGVGADWCKYGRYSECV